MRFFNRMGPVEREEHYCIPPLERVDQGEILTLIRQRAYFVVHAPRQTGKTSTLLALRDLLNSGAEGDYRCVYASLDIGRLASGDSGRATRQLLSVLRREAIDTLGDKSVDGVVDEALRIAAPDDALTEALSRWAAADPRPLVLLLDEVDTLTGDALLSVLSQLRSGYPTRPRRFPQSVVLCGLRDVQDYRAPGAKGSPFNIKAESLRLGDFTEAETRALLDQHTEETGQRFDDEALELVWSQTRGQPWLVNALAHDACFRSREGRDRSRTITAADIRNARERLIEGRATHLHNLAARLQEERVQRVVEPILSGDYGDAITDDDLEYVRDLGLVALDDPIRIANPIYAEVVPRVVASRAQRAMHQPTAPYVREGRLDLERLMGAFQEWFRENSEHWRERFGSYEAGPQLLLHSFLHRVVNGGGWIHREQPLGAGRADLLIVWPEPEGDGARRYVVECKLARRGVERAVAEGVPQTAGYMDRCDAESGHLVVFDLDAGRSWEEKIYRRTEDYEGKTITVWGM